MPGIHKGSGWLTYAAGTRPTRMKMTPRAHARPGRPWTPPRTQFRDMAAHPVGRWKQCPDARSDRAPCQEAGSADQMNQPFVCPGFTPGIGLPGGSWGAWSSWSCRWSCGMLLSAGPTSSERQRDDEIGEPRQLIESLNEFLQASNGAGAEHHTRQLSKLRPKFVFSIGLLEVAACAFTQPCDLSPIGERDGHPCWLESRHVGVERRVLANGNFPADRRDRGISNHLFGEGVIPRVPSENQRRRRVRKRVLRREVVDRIGLAHVGSKPIRRDVDPRDVLGRQCVLDENVLERVERRIDGIAAGA